MPVRIALVAAEPSGDLLGAALIKALSISPTDIEFTGIGGPKMIEAGMISQFPMEKLSVMGIFEVLPHLPELLRIRRQLIKNFLCQRPDVFVGIDAPDFNLGIAKKLNSAKIPTVQYVAPTVWAWKQGRVVFMRQVLDLVLSIFPFEKEFLQKHHVPVAYVGHPLADQVAIETDQTNARQLLGLPNDSPVLALLPGSRLSEIKRLSKPFLLAAEKLVHEIPDLKIVSPMVNSSVRKQFENYVVKFVPKLNIELVDEQANLVIAAADVVLTASGTATLQGLLNKKPMVVGYKLHSLTYAAVKLFRRIKIKHVAMANLLTDEMLAPEFIQDQCRAENIAPELYRLFTDQKHREKIRKRYYDIHLSLRQNAAEKAAQEILRIARAEHAA